MTVPETPRASPTAWRRANLPGRPWGLGPPSDSSRNLRPVLAPEGLQALKMTRPAPGGIGWSTLGSDPRLRWWFASIEIHAGSGGSGVGKRC